MEEKQCYHKETYCFIFFPGMRKAACLDRQYNYIGDDIALWGGISVRDIIQTDEDAFYPAFPEWAKKAKDDHFPSITCWTTYYE